jgi:hypothetical protein
MAGRRVPRLVCLAAVVFLSGVVVLSMLANRPKPAPPVVQFSHPGGPLLDETLGQIRIGQTRAEVESLIGPPRDEYHGTQVAVDQYVYVDKGYKLWIGRDSVLAVLYDEREVAMDVVKMAAFHVHR